MNLSNLNYFPKLINKYFILNICSISIFKLALFLSSFSRIKQHFHLNDHQIQRRDLRIMNHRNFKSQGTILKISNCEFLIKF